MLAVFTASVRCPPAMAAHWLIKSEPQVYAWTTLVHERRTVWDGVRNYEARNFLRAMLKGDLLLFYHSGDQKSVVGVARVTKAHFADPSANGEDWSAIEVAPVVGLARPVALSAMRDDAALVAFALLRKSRLSVVPATPAEFARVLALGGTKLA